MSGTPQDPSDRIAALFDHARALSAGERPAFLAAACGDDVPLREELESLLEHADAAESLFARLAGTVVPARSVPPRRFGRYELIDCIGMGGMGAVYRARDAVLDRDVALKFLPLHTDATTDAAERLVVEARAAAALEHRNVCTVHDIGATEDGRPYIAMAFYDGETLKARLARGPLSVAEALDIAVQVARGLGAAHERSIVHRDVKPGNIMLTGDGTVKLLDFGLARMADAGFTKAGVTPGTVAYMSPERLLGGVADERSDLWSLGVVLHEMVTGEHPFRGGGEPALIHAILNANPPPLGARVADVPAGLERIVERLLHKEPARRYGSAAGLLADLADVRAATLTGGAAGAVRPARRSRVWGPTIAGALILAMAGAGVFLRARGASASATAHAAQAAATEKTVAVLPFENLSGDPGQDYFSDGLTAELVGVLSRVRSLRVAARTSAFAFREDDRDAREIGAALHVGAVLEGSIRHAADSVRIGARLIRVDDGTVLWADTYARRLTDVFEVQREIASAIADALDAEVTPAERALLDRPATASAEALALYLKGRHFASQRTPAAAERAVEYFQRAIAADATYAAPHAGLAHVYLLQGLSGALAPDEAGRRIHAAVLRALELDDGSADAHAILGAYRHYFEWDAAGAEQELLRAIELDPGSTTARHQYGNLLTALGRLDEAVAQKVRAVELDPLAPSLSETLAFTLVRAGRLDEARHHVSNAIELDSTYWRAHSILALIHETAGRPHDAIASYERANELSRAATHRTRADIARVLADAGRLDEARRTLARVLAEPGTNATRSSSVASALYAVGDTDAAFAWLEEAFRQRHPHLPFLPADPRFARMANDPRFEDLMRRVTGTRRMP